MKRILLVDWESNGAVLSERLRADGHQVIECDSEAHAMAAFRTGVDAVVVHAPSRGAAGLTLLKSLRTIHADPPVIMVCASPAETLQALREGAFYVTRAPLTPDEISILAHRALAEPPGSAGARPDSPADAASRSGLGYRLPSQGIDFHELEREVLTQALRLAAGNQTRAASLLGLTRDQIRYRMAKFGMSSRDLARERAA